MIQRRRNTTAKNSRAVARWELEVAGTISGVILASP
jgi:hypothetical protein